MKRSTHSEGARAGHPKLRDRGAEDLPLQGMNAFVAMGARRVGSPEPCHELLSRCREVHWDLRNYRRLHPRRSARAGQIGQDWTGSLRFRETLVLRASAWRPVSAM